MLPDDRYSIIAVSEVKTFAYVRAGSHTCVPINLAIYCLLNQCKSDDSDAADTTVHCGSGNLAILFCPIRKNFLQSSTGQ